ncbi:MAG TPA: type II toxin-antitoxin system RelE/ParE family toxin [Planctomycetota bacterium]|nr:type II toxin-antitoxin system RelE/ParE family toxin [Planctomycetota bacterium]
MSPFRLTPSAERDLEEIVGYIASEAGPARAESVRMKIVEAARRLADMPSMGHGREDLTVRPVLFWTVHDFLIVYRPETSPLEVIRVLHGARDPEVLRREIDR